MLPSYLLPSGALSSMRTIAVDFMTTQMSIYEISLSYDMYGRQTATSGLRSTVSGYLGAIRGSDRELLNQTMQAYTRRDGVKVKTDALVLLPFETYIENDDVIRANGRDWHVVWNNNNTQDSVQVYTKAIVVDLVTQDEKENG